MLIPIGDDQVKGGYFPFFSYLFLLLNIGVFIYEMHLSSVGGIDQFIVDYSAVPKDIMAGKNLHTLITSMFLHGDWQHLLFNMLFLWIFADNIEAIIGNTKFLLFYLLAGLFSHAAHIYFNLGSEIPTIGASGAISGVLGAYLVLFPTSTIRSFIFPLFFWVLRIPAFVFLIIWIAYQAYGLNKASGLGEAGGVAWWAHIGGFVFGVVAALYFRFIGFRPSRMRPEYS